jgi:hypothetical protein
MRFRFGTSSTWQAHRGDGSGRTKRRKSSPLPVPVAEDTSRTGRRGYLLRGTRRLAAYQAEVKKEIKPRSVSFRSACHNPCARCENLADAKREHSSHRPHRMRAETRPVHEAAEEEKPATPAGSRRELAQRTGSRPAMSRVGERAVFGRGENLSEGLRKL